MIATASKHDRWLYAIVLAWLSVLVVRAAAVGGDWRPIAGFSWFVLLMWVGAYAVGYVLAPVQRLGCSAGSSLPPTAWFASWVWILSVVAIGGSALITYEFAIRRAYGFSTPVALIRLAEVAGAQEGFEGSWISGIGRVLTPALMVAWILSVLHPQRLSIGARIILLAATLTVLWEQAMFEGGRFFLAGLVVACAAAATMRVRIADTPRIRARSSRGPVLLIVAGVVILAFSYVFVERASSLDMDLSVAYATFVSSFAIDASAETLQRLDGPGSVPIFVLYMFWMYVSQGPNEFDQLLAYPYLEHGFGLVQFSLLGQGLSKLTGLNFTYDQFANMPNPGTYTTIVGPTYMDFGIVAGWLAGLALGYLTARASQRLVCGNLQRLGLAAPLLIAIGLFSPIVSLVVNLWPAILWAWLVGSSAPVHERERSRSALR